MQGAAAGALPLQRLVRGFAVVVGRAPVRALAGGQVAHEALAQLAVHDLPAGNEGALGALLAKVPPDGWYFLGRYFLAAFHVAQELFVVRLRGVSHRLAANLLLQHIFLPRAHAPPETGGTWGFVRS